MNSKGTASRTRSKQVKKNINRNTTNKNNKTNKTKSQKRASGAPWGNMSFEAILNSENPENHLKKKKQINSNLKKKKKQSRRNYHRSRKTIPK